MREAAKGEEREMNRMMHEAMGNAKNVSELHAV